MMTDERFDKLLNVMMDMKKMQEDMQTEQREMKQTQQGILQRLDQMNDKIDNLGGDITLLAQKQWENERSIHRIQKLIL